MVEGAELRFEDGLVVEVRADTGEGFLRSKVAADEGAARVGEVALVDTASAVGRRGLLFRNLLFDENASSHIALGAGYPEPVEGASEMSDDERVAAGINSSVIHLEHDDPRPRGGRSGCPGGRDDRADHRTGRRVGPPVADRVPS